MQQQKNTELFSDSTINIKKSYLGHNKIHTSTIHLSQWNQFNKQGMNLVPTTHQNAVHLDY